MNIYLYSFATILALLHLPPSGASKPDNFFLRAKLQGGPPPEVLAKLGLRRSNKDNFSLPPGRSAFSMTIHDGNEEVNVELAPNTVRAPGYQLLVQDPQTGELVETEPGPDTTYRGTCPGVPGCVVTASKSDSGITMEITRHNGKTIFVQPIGELPGTNIWDYAIYKREDVIDRKDKNTVDIMIPGQMRKQKHIFNIRRRVEETDRRKLNTLSLAELAVDADYEYYSDYGSVAAVENRITSVINTMNVQYENQVGITHKITAIIVRTSSSSQPYTQTDAEDLLNQFRNEWNSNQGEIQRDVAQ